MYLFTLRYVTVLLTLKLFCADLPLRNKRTRSWLNERSFRGHKTCKLLSQATSMLYAIQKWVLLLFATTVLVTVAPVFFSQLNLAKTLIFS
jgi:hypothetical protein